MNTLENNKLIAEFMGGKLIFPSTCNYGVFEFSKKDKNALTYDVEPTTENGIAQNLLKFHTDWNWLMSVVEKIESLGYTLTIAGVMCKVTKVLDLENSIVSYVLGDKSRKRELVYITVVAFIKWHNLNNK